MIESQSELLEFEDGRTEDGSKTARIGIEKARDEVGRVDGDDPPSPSHSPPASKYIHPPPSCSSSFAALK